MSGISLVLYFVFSVVPIIIFIFLCGYLIWLIIKIKKNRRNPIILVVVVLFMSLLLKKCLFQTSYDSDPNEQYTKYRNLWPSANGVVLDYDTKQPIKGAQVKAVGDFNISLSESGGGGGRKEYFTQTNDKGEYKIPCFWYFGYVSYASYNLTIYKAGYIVYTSRGLFKNAPFTKFKFKDNVVYLGKWDESKFTPREHIGHLGDIGCDHVGQYSEKEQKIFCQEAREEMILACMDIGSDRPLTRKICEEIAARDLGEKQ